MFLLKIAFRGSSWGDEKRDRRIACRRRDPVAPRAVRSVVSSHSRSQQQQQQLAQRERKYSEYLPTYSYARLVSRARTGIYKYKSESCHAVCREARRLVAVAALSASHLAAQPPVRRTRWTHFSVAQVLPRSPGILGSDIRGPSLWDALARSASRDNLKGCTDGYLYKR